MTTIATTSSPAAATWAASAPATSRPFCGHTATVQLPFDFVGTHVGFVLGGPHVTRARGPQRGWPAERSLRVRRLATPSEPEASAGDSQAGWAAEAAAVEPSMRIASVTVEIPEELLLRAPTS